MNVLRRYIFWTYERGSFHYDVMVTLILVFLFVSPRFIDFNEKPVQVVPLHASEVLVREQGSTGTQARFVYEIPVDELHGAKSDAELKAAIMAVVQPMAGDVALEKYAPVKDSSGKTIAYDATITR
jgi:hypothetical protein